jgi:hypothetical protein
VHGQCFYHGNLLAPYEKVNSQILSAKVLAAINLELPTFAILAYSDVKPFVG